MVNVGALDNKKFNQEVSKNLGTELSNPLKETKAPTETTKSECNKAVYLRYRDHVIFRNVEVVPTVKAVIREAIGWVKAETEEALFIEFDRPLIEGCKGFNGVIIVKNCIISMFTVTLQNVSSVNLNSTKAKKKSEYAFPDKGNEKLGSKGESEH